MLKAEYGAYRKRAVGLLREKDETVRRVAEELTAVRTKYASSAAAFAERGGSPSVGARALESAVGSGKPQPLLAGHGHGPSSHMGTPPQAARAGAGHSIAGAPHAPPGPPDGPRWEYMRNLILRYLSTTDGGVRAQVSRAPWP